MTAVYGPRCPVHPDRTGVVKSGGNRLWVLHTSEGGESATAAEGLCGFMALPGDRIVPGSDPPRVFGASYGYVFDTDRILPAVPENVVSYSAAGANNDGVHGCFPGKAGQTSAQWLDAVSLAMLKQCADAMLDRLPKLGIPLVRVTADQVVHGASGYCDHYTINLAYHKTDHTDVGPAFPWALLSNLLHPAPPDPPLEVPPMATLAGGSVRILDTRAKNTKLAAGQTIRVGVLKPPPWARAAIVDVGVAATEGPGFIAVWDGVAAMPGTSTLDYPAGSTYSNLIHVPLSGSDEAGWGFSLFSLAAAHVVVELVGWDSVV